MQKLFLTLLSLLLLTGFAFSAQITKAVYDLKTDELLFSVTYGGGCKKHTFEFKISEWCLETIPAQCSATLTETTEGGFDPCEAMISTNLKFSLKNFENRPAYLSINSGQSKASVFIPEKK